MRTQEKLIYTNERGESIEFSPASSYHVNFKDVTGLSDVRNAIYSTNSICLLYTSPSPRDCS